MSATKIGFFSPCHGGHSPAESYVIEVPEDDTQARCLLNLSAKVTTFDQEQRLFNDLVEHGCTAILIESNFGHEVGVYKSMMLTKYRNTINVVGFFMRHETRIEAAKLIGIDLTRFITAQWIADMNAAKKEDILKTPVTLPDSIHAKLATALVRLYLDKLIPAKSMENRVQALSLEQ
jgi:hypothetical protein